MSRTMMAAAACLSVLAILVPATPAVAAEPLAITVTAPADRSFTNDPTPTFTGTGTAEAVLDVELDGVVVSAAARVGRQGDWSWTTTARLTQGGHRVRATARDQGSQSVTSDVVRFTVDSIAPEPPTVSNLPSAADAGRRPQFSGYAENGASVDLLIDGRPAGRTTASASGWRGSFTLSPAEDVSLGRHTARLTASDLAGNTSAASPAVAFVVQRERPSVGLVQGSWTNDQTPDVVGSATPWIEVQISLDDDPIATVRAGADGRFGYAITTPLGEGTHTVSAVTLEAGSVTSSRGSVRVDIDLTPPDPPTIGGLTDGQTVGQKLALYGNAEDFEARPPVKLYLDGAFLGSAHWGSYEGIPHDWWDFAVTPPLASGKHTLFATTVDRAGNTSRPSRSITFIVDRTPPAAPVLETPVEGALVSRAVLSGHADPRTSLVYRLDGERSGRTLPMDATGRFSQVLSIPAGPHQVELTAILPTGTSAQTTRSFTLDPTKPAAPVVEGPSSRVTNDNAPQFSGRGEAGATVAVAVDGRAAVVTAPVGADGRWSVRLPAALTDGRHVVVITQADRAGNISDAISRTVTIDTVAPAAPVLAYPAASAVITQTKPAIHGNGESGAVVEIALDDTPTSAVRVDASGMWRLTTTTLSEGRHTLSLSQIDPAGNRSPGITADFAVADTTAPERVSVTAPADGAAVTSSTATFHGTGEPGAIVRVQVVGYPVQTTEVGPDGTWTLSVAAELVAGEHTFRADQVDAVGNVSLPVTVTFLVRVPRPTPSTSSPSASSVAAPSGTPTVAMQPSTAVPAATTSAVARPAAGIAAPVGAPAPSPGPADVATSAPPSVATLARTGGPSLAVAVLAGLLVLGGVVVLSRSGRRR